jgi:thymidine kinase
MGYMIKGMMPIIETTNSILKATLKKESFEPAKNLRTTSDGLRMLSAMCTLNKLSRLNDLLLVIVIA